MGSSIPYEHPPKSPNKLARKLKFRLVELEVAGDAAFPQIHHMPDLLRLYCPITVLFPELV